MNSPIDSSTSSLLCHFAGLTDPRKPYLIEHELLDIIAITICWSLDVAFHEDDYRIRTGHAPENMTLIRKIALNLLSQETSTPVGNKAKRLKAGWDNHYLAKVLTP
jgi:hypothetical protein